jgi:adenine phosphoribosyltransferase
MEGNIRQKREIYYTITRKAFMPAACTHISTHALLLKGCIKQWIPVYSCFGGTSMADFDLDMFIRKIPDFPKKGILFYDITGILANPKALAYCIDAMAELYQGSDISAVAAIEARGFVFAAPFAVRMNIPLILIRKRGKLPGKVISKKFTLEYTESEIELQPDDVPVGKRVLLFDDLIATGGTLNAAKELIERAGATVPEIFGVIGLPFLHYEELLTDVTIRTLIQYEGE